MSSSSSSDSDSHEKAKFKDATIDVATILHKTAQDVKSFKNRRFAPLHSNDQNSYRKGLELDTTAEFRSFVAKKLFESLERRIKFKKVAKETASEVKEENDRHSSSDWGFRLFSSSISNSRTEVIPKTGKRSRSKSSSSNSDSDETLASVAVDLQTILDDRTMLNKFRAKEKMESIGVDRTQEQTERHLQTDTDTSDQRNTKPKDKKKVKVDKKLAT